jgi:catechol 2,3-dioxygenase-like lactoylglutathione lyase family enzyme
MEKHAGVTFQVRVPDFEAGLRFYAKLLGREPDLVPHGGFAEWEIVPNAWLQVGEGQPEIGRPIRFGVEDIRNERERLASELGVEVSEIEIVHVADSGAIACWCDFEDPFGNRLGLFQDLSKG